VFLLYTVCSWLIFQPILLFSRKCIDRLFALLTNTQTSAEILARKKRFSLFYQCINDQEKCFLAVDFIKLLTLSQMLQLKKLDFFVLDKLFQPSLMFQNKTLSKLFDLAGIYFPGTNTLAYFVASSVIKRSLIKHWRLSEPGGFDYII
jgi:hypothetical protein